MKENNELISFLNSSISFSPNYNDIKFRINETQFKNNIKKTYNYIKILKLSMYSIIICVVSVLCTIIVKDNMNSIAYDVSPGKESIQFLEENFDEFFAFGSGSSNNIFTIDLIINSTLINNNSKEELLKYKNEYYKKRNFQYFNIYLGNKSGKDIVLLYPLGEPGIMFKFDSNLSYEYKDIIYEFQLMSGSTLTKDFIYGKNFDNVLRKETIGIILSFQNIDGKYIPYYTIELDKKIYVINK